MKKPPNRWPQISSAVYYEDPSRAIDWLCRVFGFEIRIRIEGENGSVEHSELEYGQGLVMVSGVQAKPGKPWTYRTSPRALSGANTQSMMVFVDDVEAHCAAARAEGAKVISEPTTSDYGPNYWTDRTYEAEDLEGHHWWFVQRLREQAP